MSAIRVLDVDWADPVHRGSVLGLLDAYARDPMGGSEPLPADVKERLLPALEAHPTTRVLLAFDDDTAVGIAVCFLGFSTFAARPLLNIHDLAVLAEWRGRGVGRALLAAVEDRARRAGCCKLTLEVLETNVRARSLYERFGFTDYVLGDAGSTRFLAKPLEP